jgi:hypothetical protein
LGSGIVGGIALPDMLPTTEIFAFSAPKNKAGELHIAINTGAGLLHVLRASRSVWHNLAEKLAAEFPDVARAAAASVAQPAARPVAEHRLRGAERARVFMAVLTKIEREEISQVAACDAAGVSYYAFVAWLREYRRAGYRPPTIAETVSDVGRAPITKPGGRIL